MKFYVWIETVKMFGQLIGSVQYWWIKVEVSVPLSLPKLLIDGVVP